MLCRFKFGNERDARGSTAEQRIVQLRGRRMVVAVGGRAQVRRVLGAEVARLGVYLFSLFPLLERPWLLDHIAMSYRLQSLLPLPV